MYEETQNVHTDPVLATEPPITELGPKNDPTIHKMGSNRKKAFVALAILLVIILLVGVYLWRDKVANDLVSQKNASILSLEKAKTAMDADLKQRDTNIASLKITNSTLVAQQKQKDSYITTLEKTNATQAEKAAAETLNSTAWRDFTSTKFGFNIQFPGIPYEDSSQTLSINSVAAPMTAYSRSNENGYYVAEVATYTTSYIKSLPSGDSKLSVAMLNAVGFEDGASTVSSALLDFHGYRAMESVLSIDYGNGYKADKYGLVFFKDNYLYVLYAYGTQKADFDKFIGSFSFK
ncbi:MAG: hypothetical protein WCJ36_00835 [Candidatus Saccharibacteria bacterium]